MLEKNFIKVTEIIVLGLLFPITVICFKLSNYILPFLWIITIYTLIIFFYHYKVLYYRTGHHSCCTNG